MTSGDLSAAGDPGAGCSGGRWMRLYWTGAVIACMALVLVSAIIPWAVYTRYVLNSASSWPEPLAVMLTVGITFIGAANCYRQRIHMNMTVGTDLLPPRCAGGIRRHQRTADGRRGAVHAGVGHETGAGDMGQFGR